MYSFGAHFAEVRVHAMLGQVKVKRLVARLDVGCVLNFKGARG